MTCLTQPESRLSINLRHGILGCVGYDAATSQCVGDCAAPRLESRPRKELIEGREIEMKRVVRIAGIAMLALVLPGVAASAAGADHVGVGMRAAKPKVLCANYKHQFFYFRARPANCDFPGRSAQPGSIGSWDVFPTRRVRWNRWGYQSAVGRGRGFMRTVGWRPLRIRLKRSRVVCGRRVFTRMRVRLKAPGGWLGWGRWGPIKTCV